MQFDGAVVDWNMGTLLRANCKGDISDKNTILGQLVEECLNLALNGFLKLVQTIKIIQVEQYNTVKLFELEGFHVSQY